jgi:hypothetical protein
MYEPKHFGYTNNYEEVWHLHFRIPNIRVSTR